MPRILGSLQELIFCDKTLDHQPAIVLRHCDAGNPPCDVTVSHGYGSVYVCVRCQHSIPWLWLCLCQLYGVEMDGIQATINSTIHQINVTLTRGNFFERPLHSPLSILESTCTGCSNIGLPVQSCSFSNKFTLHF